MRLAASVELYSYGCPCNDGKTGLDYHNLLESKGFKNRMMGDNAGNALKRGAGDKPGTSSHVVTWDATSGGWEHQHPDGHSEKGIGYDSLKKHLEEAA